MFQEWSSAEKTVPGANVLFATIDVKNVEPRNKNVMRFYEKNKNDKKSWIKNVVDKLKKLFKPNAKILQ